MYFEELAWATIREREAEIRRLRPHTEERPAKGLPFRSRLARVLVEAGIRLDSTAGDSPPGTAVCADF